MQLSKGEEQIMEYLWQLEQAYMKDLIEAFPDPKPKATTVATLLMRMQKKEAIAYHTHGNSRAYYPLVSKNDYFSKQVKGMINNFFGGSTTQFASFFTSFFTFASFFTCFTSFFTCFTCFTSLVILAFCNS